MDDILPSYGQATARDHWSIISSFVRSQDLCSAALVSREWNQIFMRHLWGNPASHFGTQNDAVYVALVRFKRTLSRARLTTRELTHTLHLPPAQAEIYDGPHSEWLYEILQRLPRLQSLIVAQLPFFDHGSLLSLEDRSRSTVPNAGLSTVYNLRLLDASNCSNITPQALSAALRRFPALLYLDVSGTLAAKHSVVLSNLCHNPALQILKMRKLSLTDNEMKIFAKATGRNLRSLDVRDNRFSDQAIRTLLDECIGTTTESSAQQRHACVNGAEDTSLLPRLGAKVGKIFDSEAQDEYIRCNLTSEFVSSIGLERTSGSGITHLYISGNLITVEGVFGLLRSGKLRVLDVGSILTGINPAGHASVALPGVEKLTPIMEKFAKDLTYLRINHAIVTQDVSPADAELLEMEDFSTLLFPSNAVELDTTEQTVHELPDEPLVELSGDIPIYAELEGSPVPHSTPLPNTKENTPQLQMNALAARRGSAVAPEPISAISPAIDSSGGLFSPVSPLRPSPVDSPMMDAIINAPTPPPGDHLSIPTPRSHKRTYSGVLSEHEAHIKYRLAQNHSLLPSMLPSIQTLVLTNVPQTAPTDSVAKHIIQFINDCADEEQWAKLQATVGYALPPGRDRRSAERQYARSLFPLRKVVLEMAPRQPIVNATSGWRRPSNPSIDLSSVQDPDCEMLWNAAKDDFSFFGAEECGQPDIDPAARIPLAALTEKMTVAPEIGQQWQDRNAGRSESSLKTPNFDVLAEVSRFRREKKAKYEAAVTRGDNTDTIEGYWHGEIVVIRPRL